MPDTLQPIAGRYEFCDCGHVASFDLIVAVGWPRPKPVSEPVCARCASLEAGRFDTFLDSLPTGDVPRIIDLEPVAVDGWPVRDTAGIPQRTAPSPDARPGIPVFDTAQQSGYTPDQIAHIRRLYTDLGSLKAVQRHLYDQEGGHWFYEIRKVINGR